MKVCIIIPVFNEEDFIEKSIKSIINQTVKPEKVIYVNDSSTVDKIVLTIYIRGKNIYGQT